MEKEIKTGRNRKNDFIFCAKKRQWNGVQMGARESERKKKKLGLLRMSLQRRKTAKGIHSPSTDVLPKDGNDLDFEEL